MQLNDLFRTFSVRLFFFFQNCSSKQPTNPIPTKQFNPMRNFPPSHIDIPYKRALQPTFPNSNSCDNFLPNQPLLSPTMLQSTNLAIANPSNIGIKNVSNLELSTNKSLNFLKAAIFSSLQPRSLSFLAAGLASLASAINPFDRTLSATIIPPGRSSLVRDEGVEEARMRDK